MKTLTVPQIRIALSEAGKAVSRETLYVYFRRYKIKPLGARQSPQRYPQDVPGRILEKLGLVAKPRRNGHTKR